MMLITRKEVPRFAIEALASVTFIPGIDRRSAFGRRLKISDL
jgi:hypothetical protein